MTGRQDQCLLFLPATIDRTEKINRYFNLIKLLPLDIDEDIFVICKDGISFDPSKLDIGCQQKKIITLTIVEMIKLVADISNVNIVRNTECFFFTKNIRRRQQ